MRVCQADQSGLLLETLLRLFSDTKRTRLKQCLKNGGVLVNGRRVTRFDHPVRPGDKIAVASGRQDQAAVIPSWGVRILFEDDFLIAADKPSGLLSIASETVRERTAIFAVNDYLNRKENLRHPLNPRRGGLQARRRKMIFVVHRLDRGASGVLLFAKDVKVKEQLQRDWETFSKTYLAAVESCPHPEEGTVTNYLRENKRLRVEICRPCPEAKKAVTHYRVLKKNKEFSLLEVRLETGRKHQIRVHLSGLGCPIAGDKDYGSLKNPAGRLALHASRLEIFHPVSGRRITFKSALPPELEGLV